jgi:TolB-like protein
MAKLGDHPHIVTVYDIGDEGEQPFIVSQYMAGGDVQALLEAAPANRLPLEQVIRIADHVCQALEYVHERGFIHRDLKPANVWLMPDGVAKLGDFGLAITPGRARLTMPGTMVGTVVYMAPEQALGHQHDARTDLYALGAMLYELATGRPPFVGDDAVAITSQHINAAPEPPSLHNPEVPRSLDALVLRLLAKRSQDRPASAAAVREALRAISSTGGGGAQEQSSEAATSEMPAQGLVSGDRESAVRPIAATEGGVERRRLRALATWSTDAGRRARIRKTILGLAAALGLLGVAAHLWFREPGIEMPYPPEPTVVGVMNFEVQGPAPDLEWMCQSTRDSLNTALSKVKPELRVYAKEMIDFYVKEKGLREVEVAQMLGIAKMITGVMSLADSTVTLELRIVDMEEGGFLDESIPRRSPRGKLIKLQNAVISEVLRALNVTLTPEREAMLFAHRTDETLENYNLLYDTLGEFVEEAEEPSEPSASKPSRVPRLLSFVRSTAVAYAQEVDAEHAGVQLDGSATDHGGDTPSEGIAEGDIHALLEQYRAALEAENIDQLASLHVKLTEGQRSALGRYFANTHELKVQISNIDVVIEGAAALATFTREDQFRDARSGREIRLEVRLSSLLVKENGGWKIRGLKKPS